MSDGQETYPSILYCLINLALYVDGYSTGALVQQGKLRPTSQSQIVKIEYNFITCIIL